MPGVIGRNGAGKTTLLQLVCGITLPTYGDVKTRGSIAPVLALGAGLRSRSSPAVRMC